MRRRDQKREKFPNASQVRVGIVRSLYHADITGRLLRGAEEMLARCRVKKANIRVVEVSGSFEIPFGCRVLLEEKKYDALVALGCILKGETEHDLYIASAVTYGIAELSLRYGVPIGFGVLTVRNLAQANVRSAGEANKGREAALAAVRMAFLK
jgi:6,7-dimethyl-8-ribityllumazine synthase